MPVPQKFAAEIMDLLCAGFINWKIAIDKDQDVHEDFYVPGSVGQRVALIGAAFASGNAAA